MLEPVIQEEPTGCGIAAVACLLSRSYAEMQAQAARMGIHAADRRLWSETGYVRDLLASAGVATAAGEQPFTAWDALPDLALLAIKHHREEGRDFWHWVVFQREAGESIVLDSASYLPSNRRQDFSAMQPRWFIRVGAA